MAKNSYEQLKEEILSKSSSTNSVRHSKSDHTALTQALINTPEHKVTVYDKNDKEKVSTLQPGRRFREALKPVIKSFGVDSAEVQKIDALQFNKELAESINEVSTTVSRDYVDVGRKLILPIQSETQSQVEVQKALKKEKSDKTKKLVEVAPGKFETQPTGKERTVKAHEAAKLTNKVPAWLVSEKNI